MDNIKGLSLDVEQSARMTLVHPITNEALKDAEGKEAYIDLCSMDSTRARAHVNNVANRRFQRAARVPMTAEQLEAEQIEGLSKLTTGWLLIGLDGVAIDLPFSEAAARALYANRATLWVREQVEAFVNARSNFLPG